MTLATEHQHLTAAPLDFIGGKPYVHHTGEFVMFDDDSWLISPTIGDRTSVSFGDLPAWFVRPVKITLSHGWLSLRRSPNWCAILVSTFRQMSTWLEDFNGGSMADLRNEHKLILQRRIDQEITRYRDTLHEAATKAGRVLSDRENKRIQRESKLHGPKFARNAISAFNMAAILYEEIDGTTVPVRLKRSKLLKQCETRSVGSANPDKVLSPDQIANIEYALRQDLRRYRKGLETIKRHLQSLDLRKAEFRPLVSFDTERYFGLNGFREHRAKDVATLRGLSPNSAPDVTRRISKFLSHRLGAPLAAEVLQLRSQFGQAGQNLSEVTKNRDYVRTILANVDLSAPASPTSLCIVLYFGLKGNRMHPASAIGAQVGLTEISVSRRISAGLRRSIGETKSRRIMAIREALPRYLSRAIKAQALRLQLAAARRVSAILELESEPKVKVQSIAGRRIVEIQFRSRKTWGDEGLLEWVPCVDGFGEMAEDAIRTAQGLTAEIRPLASEDAQKRLFIIPGRSIGSAIALTTKVLAEYLYTNQPGKVDLLRRHKLDDLLSFQLHHARHTHSTHMMEAGGTVQDVARYLGHILGGGSTRMAATFYLAGGTDKMRHRTAEALRRGAATGMIFDGVARMKTEAMGEEAKNITVPPNQLSFEEAKRRVLQADIVDDIPMSPQEAGKLASQKVVFNVTRYGGCLLQANSGPCPTANPCPIGILPKGTDPVLGCGCKYLVLLPDSVEQLTADIEVMESQLSRMQEDQWGWKSHTEAKLDHYKSLLETARSLNGST
ncbi:MAG TPA: hypothetical protein VFX97_01585 [Pyrinomonadaceae bacterium]|nr:hypothetical protein [Pyrinomonadaceae bacterium]